ncbi:SpoIIE family protein phosphatase [Streptomyces sp. V4-01]|uniref:SpoIIE family protein phosphatase n=1 Tax=Actinacidiphila polyblastidii TaxID=3110430 RepID=A0ABU7PM41_9ACTN|nr:SpoIIE family protein phosphatase [Streptomyces sp. V4-01]
MTEPAGQPAPGVDYRQVYLSLPAGVALLSPDLVYLDVNGVYERMAGRPRADLIGHNIFDLFPDPPDAPEADGSRNLGASLRHVAATGERDTMGLQRYDVERQDRPGHYDERYWSIINVPVLGRDGAMQAVLHRVEEVTAFIRTRGILGDRDRAPRELEAELYMRARELQEVNDRLRRAHAHEREIALALQDAMLPAPQPVGHRAAVRYRPAIGAINVCGDWYDLVDLPGDRIAVAVGDVVGHGLSAAGVMGQLRSALSAASRVTDGPAAALETLGLYARSVDGGECATAVSTHIDWTARSVTYSSAGHPPAALVDQDGFVRFLDQATDPPLGARPEHMARLQATVPFVPGSTLVLYTDGLIERRGEDIDVGLARLATALTEHCGLDAERMADALLDDLLAPRGATDDTALVVLRL